MGSYEYDSEVIATSKVFQKGKTVLPSEIRKILGIIDGDKVVWRYNKIRGIVFLNAPIQKGVRYTKEERHVE